jgi:hypothetical protein
MPDRPGPSGNARRVARATRAYLAGIGTSGSLLAGAALMFVLGSALVAFHGWPHVAAQPSPGEVVVSPSSATAGSPVARRLAFITAAAAAGGAGAPGSGAPGRGVTGVHRVATRGGQHSIGAPASVSQTGGGAGAGGSSSAPGCEAVGCSDGGSSPGSGAVPPAPQPVEQVAGALGNVVGGAGRTVGATVRRATSTVGAVVGTVSPSGGNAVSDTGSGAAKALGGVTQTIAGALSDLGH